MKMNDMKLIMEGWRSHLVKEHIRENLLEDHLYITEVLGISLPLNESGEPLSLTEELKNKIIEEQLLFEGFWSGVWDAAKNKVISLADGIKQFGKAGWEIMSGFIAVAKDPTGRLSKKFADRIKRGVDPRRERNPLVAPLNKLIDKLESWRMGALAKPIKLIISGWTKIYNKTDRLQGWKRLLGLSGLAVLTKYAWKLLGGGITAALSSSADKIESIKKNVIDPIIKWWGDSDTKALLGKFSEFAFSNISGLWKTILAAASGAIGVVVDSLGQAADEFSHVYKDKFAT